MYSNEIIEVYTFGNIWRLLQERGFWKLNFRIGGRKPPDITPWFRTPDRGVLKQEVMFGVYVRQSWNSFQVSDVWFFWFYPALPLNGGLCPVATFGASCNDVSKSMFRWWYKFQEHQATEQTTSTLCLKKSPHNYHFVNNSVKNHPIFMIFVTRYPQEIWHHKLMNLPTSPVCCGCTTLRSVKSHISLKSLIHSSKYCGYVSWSNLACS